MLFYFGIFTQFLELTLHWCQYLHFLHVCTHVDQIFVIIYDHFVTNNINNDAVFNVDINVSPKLWQIGTRAMNFSTWR